MAQKNVRERQVKRERERDRQTDRQRQRERGVLEYGLIEREKRRGSK